MDLYWIIAAPLIAALLAPALARAAGTRKAGILLAAIPFGIAGWLVSQALAAAPPALWSAPWIPSLGVDLALFVGGFERLFLLLVSFIGGLILIYGGAYLEDDAKAPRFFVVVLIFMASMLGVIAADDLILTFVFWELTSISSFLLIGYKHGDAGARKAALQSLLVTGAGGLALLGGLILLQHITGVSRISALAGYGETIAASPWYGITLALILLGAFTKSAQVPFHFWLPGAMAAPTPVSAYLHSATMVKAGVILLAKLSPALAETPLWSPIVAPIGALTFLTGAVLAIGQTDLKRLLAYTTVSILGALVMLLGFGDAFSFKTAMFLALVHGFYKGSLFMVAGVVDHATGTRDVRDLSGLGKAVPLLFFAAAAAALSMCGVPPTLGFISKELLYEAQLSLPATRHIYTAAGVIASALGVAIAITVGIRPFLGKPGAKSVHHHPGIGLLLPPAILAGLGLILGLMPSWLDRHWISPAAAALGMGGSHAKLSLWHGFTPVLALSVLTLVLGILLFRFRSWFLPMPAALDRLARISPTGIYQGLLDGTLALAAFLTGWIQNGRLRVYVRVTILGATALILLGLAQASTGIFPQSFSAPGIFPSIVVILMSASAIAAVRSRSRLGAILCLGGVGYSVALLFVIYGAPDLAITQLLVETLTVVLFSFVILKLPQVRVISRSWKRRTDAVIATFAGLSMTLLCWKASSAQMHEPISPGLVARSLEEANGRNVVNVILVDFRALDTLGEILVLALACIGITALLARKRKLRPTDELHNERAAANEAAP